jgi:hypothetical protein
MNGARDGGYNATGPTADELAAQGPVPIAPDLITQGRRWPPRWLLKLYRRVFGKPPRDGEGLFG